MPKAKKPTVSELELALDEASKKLKEEEAVRSVMRKKAETAEKKLEEFQGQVREANLRQVRAEAAAREAEKARLLASKKAAVDKVNLERRLADSESGKSGSSQELAQLRMRNEELATVAADQDAVVVELQNTITTFRQQVATARSQRKAHQEDADDLRAKLAKVEDELALAEKRANDMRESGMNELAQQLGPKEDEIHARVQAAEAAAFARGHAEGLREGGAAANAALVAEEKERHRKELDEAKVRFESTLAKEDQEHRAALADAKRIAQDASDQLQRTAEERIAALVREHQKQLEGATPVASGSPVTASPGAVVGAEEAAANQVLRQQLHMSEERARHMAKEISDLRAAWDVAEAQTRDLMEETKRLRLVVSAHDDAHAPGGLTTSPFAAAGASLGSHAACIDSSAPDEVVVGSQSSPARPLSVPERMELEDPTHTAARVPNGQGSLSDGNLPEENRYLGGVPASALAARLAKGLPAGVEAPVPHAAPVGFAATGGFRPLHAGRGADPVPSMPPGSAGFSSRSPPVPPLQAHKPASFITSPRWSRALTPRSARVALGASWDQIRGQSHRGLDVSQPAPPVPPLRAHKPASFSTSARWTRALTPRTARGVQHFNRPTTAPEDAHAPTTTANPRPAALVSV